MKRRAFLSLMGAAGVAPALPSLGAPASAAAGYNRYMYGLAVFQARTRASISAADLMARLKVNAVQAEAMMGEMTTKGVIAPVAKATAATARQALNPQYDTGLRKAVRQVSEWIETAEERLVQTHLDGDEDTDLTPDFSGSEELDNDQPH